MELLLPEEVLEAYKLSYFPMAESKEGEIFWHSPEMRAIFDINSIDYDKNVVKKIKKGVFGFTINHDFDFVINSCADRSTTWINNDIIDTYNELHRMGYAHSIEVWHNNEVCGGLYGLAIGGAFFGESMFNTISDASKAAFYYLINHLIAQNFVLLDSQYINDFTKKLGAFEIPKKEYQKLLAKALDLDRWFV